MQGIDEVLRLPVRRSRPLSPSLPHPSTPSIRFFDSSQNQTKEHNIWGKHTNFELGTRVPFIVSSPGDIAPGVSDALVELVDLYPTVAAVAGLPPPSDLDGIDLSPLFNKTQGTAAGVAALKDAVFSEYPRCFLNLSTPWDGYIRPAPGNHANGWGNCMSVGKHWIRAMGHSVRTADYRYTIWLPWDGRRVQSDFDAQPLGEELYLHSGDDGTDFDAYENSNVVADPRHAAVVKELFAMAKGQWDRIPPPPSPLCSAVRQGNVDQGAEFVGGAESQPAAHSPGTSALDCCQQCGAAANCSYFTFSADRGMCQLHTSVAGLRSIASATSGALDGAPPPPPPVPPSPRPPSPAPKPPGPPQPAGSCMVQARLRYSGNLLGYIPGSSANTCCKQCSQVSGCIAFTFTPESLRCSCWSNIAQSLDDASSSSGNVSAAVTVTVT